MRNNILENGGTLRITRVAGNAAILSVGRGTHISVVDGKVIPIVGLPIRNLNTGERTEPMIPKISADITPAPNIAIQRPGLQPAEVVFQVSQPL